MLSRLLSIRRLPSLYATIMQRLVSVREKFHSNIVGLHVDSGYWQTSERLHTLTYALFPGSGGTEEAQARAALTLGGQVKIQAYTLAYTDAYLAIALVAAFACILIAFMKPMKIYFNETATTSTK